MTKRRRAAIHTPRPPRDEADEVDAFERAMADVARIEPDPRGRVRTTPPLSLPHAEADADRVVEDPVEFLASGIDRRALRQLRRGEYAVGARLDLHGLTVADAAGAAKRFVHDSRHRRLRCICIVHGRGLHSKGQVSTVKARVRADLRGDPAVLAYADAPMADGGPGAVYVLLRRG